jgi:general nucleoside transport system permease protein
VAINILAAGVARFLSVVAYAGATGGGATQSPRIPTGVGTASLPFLAGGELFGWQSPNLFGWVERQGIPFISDLGALARGLTGNVSWLLVITVALVPITWFVLWRTTFGLRLRSVGEHPVAAESLGVRVYTMKYIGVTVSGALAGLGGAILVLDAAGIYREGQTGGRGFIALAALIFGNWRPGGVAAGAALFGFASALELRSGEAVHGLLLYLAIALAAATIWAITRRRTGQAIGLGIPAVLIAAWWVTTDVVPSQIIFMTPYITTLIVLAFFATRLRPPAAVGRQYRRGQLE